MTCVGTADTIAAAFSMIETLRPDAVVMDVQVGHDDGLTATAELVRQYPTLRVVVLTAFSTEPLLRRAVSAGASALLAKDGAVEDLIAALRPAGPDEFNVDPALLRRLLAVRREQGGRSVMLTTREDQVLHLLAEGLDTTTIAKRLGISRHTCRGYVGSLFGKLDAHSQLEAVAVAKRKGLLRESG
jgi:two-component system response regulator DesR